ncbi:MAG: MOSC N-terminal beta barrel domain-containing protein [Halofilum sp. (in: g-proteobacteria)]|nr:MOSC N-terminal beta barrel domain-containing protein [Halofilum sp. (in: g-proteobacteria)]
MTTGSITSLWRYPVKSLMGQELQQADLTVAGVVGDRVLSRFIGREVRLERFAPEGPSLEEYLPDIRELPERGVLNDEAMASGTFFDVAVIHLLTTATLERLQPSYRRASWTSDGSGRIS